MIHRNIFYGHSQVTFSIENIHYGMAGEERGRERHARNGRRKIGIFILFNLVNEQTH